MTGNLYAITSASFRAVASADDACEGEVVVDRVPAHLLDALSLVPKPYLPNTPEHYRAIREAAWNWMTGYVKLRRYDSIESCCSYANSTVPRYKAEALAMIRWRDAVNVRLEGLVVNPPAGLETWEQVKALLPQPEEFQWPVEIDLPLGGGEAPVVLT